MGDDFDIVGLRDAVKRASIEWRQHALERLLERSISRAEVLRAILDGEVIEVYSTDRPFPSCLMLNIDSEPIHVIAAVDSLEQVCYIISAYRPDMARFEPDFKTRKARP